MKLRIGQGMDFHPFVANKKLVLGGVEIDHDRGLAGHSDADALIHAICDGLFGALAMGDLGSHFPDTDPQYNGRSSIFFLEEAVLMIREKGWKVANIDATIVTEAPKISPHVESMKEALSEALQIKSDQLSIKATRPEKMGALGREEGLFASAIVLLQK